MKYGCHIENIAYSPNKLYGHISQQFCTYMPKHSQYNIYFTCYSQICVRKKYAHQVGYICHIFKLVTHWLQLYDQRHCTHMMPDHNNNGVEDNTAQLHKMSWPFAQVS